MYHGTRGGVHGCHKVPSLLLNHVVHKGLALVSCILFALIIDGIEVVEPSEFTVEQP